MTKGKFLQLWNNIIVPAIKDYLQKYTSYELECGLGGLDVLRDSVEDCYNKLRPYFKDEYMKKYDVQKQGDNEIEDNEIRADRHKVAALLYLALACNPQSPFVRLKPMKNKNKIFDLGACHEIAYDVSLNCIESFISFAQQRTPDFHKAKFLNNNGFDKTPPLICEKYTSYKSSIISRMVWAVEEASRQFEGETTPMLREMRVATNANMLANIFYFLELHSAS
jgi:hypothetical protein